MSLCSYANVFPYFFVNSDLGLLLLKKTFELFQCCRIYCMWKILCLLKTLPVMPSPPVLEKNLCEALTQLPDKSADQGR